MTWHPDAATSSVFATLAFNMLLAMGCIVLFEYFRNYQLDIYSPKLRKKPLGDTIPKPSTGLFGWIVPVWKASDDEVLRIAGVDAYVMLRHLKMCFKICSACTLGGVILLAVYYTAPGDDSVYGIAKFSMANVPNKGERLWASCVFTYVFTFTFLYLIDVEYENFAKIRARYLKGSQDDGMPEQMRYSVIVENIPEEYRTSPRLKEFMQSLFPGDVLHNYVAISMDRLEEIVLEREVLLAKLEDCIAMYESSKVRPLVFIKKGVLVPAYGKQGMDAIDFISDQISILSAEIAELQVAARAAETGEKVGDKLSGPSAWLTVAETSQGIALDVLKNVPGRELSKSISKYTGEVDQKIITTITDMTSELVAATGFVTFSSKRTQAVAIGLPILSAAYPNIQVGNAPAPSDIIWCNLSASSTHTEAMAYLTAAGYYTGLLFWTVILAFIAAISNLSYLAQYLPFLNYLSDSAYAVLQGILPVIIMMTFLSLVPYIMQLVSTYIERRKTISSVQAQVFKWFFLYQIANVYLLLLAGSAVTSISDVIDDPAGILYTISNALPVTSVFFMNYLLTTTLTGITLNYLQIVPMLYLAFIRIVYKSSRMTRRMLLEGPLAKITVNFGATLPDGLYVLCITLLYWVISPILLLLSTLYFSAAYLCWKYQYLYVIIRDFESGGKFWYGLYQYSMTALLASTVTIIAYTSIKEGIIQAPLMFPLPFMVLYQWRRTEKKYKALSQITPYSVAVAVDMNKENNSQAIASFTEDYLKQPCVLAPIKVKPYPYRVQGKPLLNEKGLLNEVYLNDHPVEEEQNKDAQNVEDDLKQPLLSSYHNPLQSEAPREEGAKSKDGKEQV